MPLPLVPLEEKKAVLAPLSMLIYHAGYRCRGGARKPPPENVLHTLSGFGAPGSHFKVKGKDYQNRGNN